MQRTSPSSGGFRLRFIPAACLFIFGGLLTLITPIGAIARLVLESQGIESLGQHFAGAAAHILAGVLLVASGRWTLQGRWWLAVLGVIIGYVLGVAGAMMLYPGRA